MKDTTVTIHPTVKLSFAYALYRMADTHSLSIGKIFEKCAEEHKEIKEFIEEFHNKKGS